MRLRPFLESGRDLQHEHHALLREQQVQPPGDVHQGIPHDMLSSQRVQQECVRPQDWRVQHKAYSGNVRRQCLQQVLPV